MNLNSILCVCLAVVTLTLGNQAQDGAQSNGDASYEFGYDIHNPVSNDIKSHHEVRDGKNVLGFYTFKEADGSIRIVKYKVTPETGFEAVVEKIKPDEPLPGNSIDGQVAAPSTHGLPQAVTEPRGGANSQYVNRVVNPRIIQNPKRDIPVAATRQNPQHPQGYRNPYVIRRNNNQQLPAVYNNPQETQYPIHHNQRVAAEPRYVDVPRGRQRNQFTPRHPEQRQFQNIPQPRHRFGPRQSQGHPQANNQVQPTPPAGPIVYIDGVPYIDDIGAFSGQGTNKEVVINGHVFVPSKKQGQGQEYEAREGVERNEKARSRKHDDDDDKDEFEDDDDDDVELANFEDDDDDEDSDASDFYEENEQLINHQEKEYARLKKAYEDGDGDQEESDEQEEEKKKPVAKAKEQEASEEQKPEPVQE